MQTMKLLGMIGIYGGLGMIVVGVIVFVEAGLVAIGPALLGIISIICGSLCNASDDQSKRLDKIERKLGTIHKAIGARNLPDEIVDQLREEGIIGTQPPVDDSTVDNLLKD